MGSIASVLQWHCQTCGQINPTESVKCLKCGTKRVSSHDSGIYKENCRDSSPEYTSRTGKSEGTTPGSEPIVIPTENCYNRCVFFSQLCSTLSYCQELSIFRYSYLRLYFYCISLLCAVKASSLSKLVVSVQFLVSLCQELSEKCNYMCRLFEMYVGMYLAVGY